MILNTRIHMNNNIFLSSPENASMFQQYQQFMQQHQQVDTYAQLEKELQSMSDADVAGLSSFKPYNEANNALAILVQGELLKLVRSEINKKPEVINNVISAIKEFKSIKQKEQDDFQDYIKNFSDLTYKEYKELKNEKR